MKILPATLGFVVSLLLPAGGVRGQNYLSNQLNNKAAEFNNSGMPAKFGNAYSELANLKDYGMGGSGLNALNFGMQMQAMEATQQRIDEIFENAKRQMERDTRNIREAGRAGAQNIDNAARQGLANLDAIDHAEAGPSKHTSKRPSVEFGNSFPGDKIIKYIGSTPIYELEGANDWQDSPVSDVLNDALDAPPEGDTFQPGAASNDIPNSFVMPGDGQMVTVFKDGSSQSIDAQAPPGMIYTKSLEQALNGEPGQWEQIGYDSRFEMAKDYVRNNDILKEGGMPSWDKEMRACESNITRLQAKVDILSRNQQTYLEYMSSQEFADFKANAQTAGLAKAGVGASDLAFDFVGWLESRGMPEGTITSGDVLAAAKTIVMAPLDYDATIGTVSLDFADELNELQSNNEAAGLGIQALQAMAQLKRIQDSGRTPTGTEYFQAFNTMIGTKGVGDIIEGYQMRKEGKVMHFDIQNTLNAYNEKITGLKEQILQERVKQDQLKKPDLEALRKKNQAIREAFPKLSEQLDKLSYKPDLR